MKRHRTIGFDHGPLPMLVDHDFTWDGGRLTHYIDGTARAEVPPEGLADYVATWPEAAKVLDEPAPPPPAQ